MYTLELPSVGMVGMGIVQAIILLLIAPFLSGLSRMIRARMHSRRGPGLLQDYRDIFKLLKRQDVSPAHAGKVFRITPFILVGTMLVVAISIPVFTKGSLAGVVGDLITEIYLFAIFRFFFALSGLDTGSGFAAIGASRELTMGVLVEPTLLLGFIVVALVAGSTNVGDISQTLSHGWQFPLATLLALVACAFACFIEMGKMPFDLAEAEQELQEGPLTEYSGPSLALVKWGLSLKQVVIAELFLAVFFPFGNLATPVWQWSLVIAVILFIVKLLVVFFLASVFENSLARGRFLLTHRVTWLGFGVAALAFVFYLIAL